MYESNGEIECKGLGEVLLTFSITSGARNACCSCERTSIYSAEHRGNGCRTLHRPWCLYSSTHDIVNSLTSPIRSISVELDVDLQRLGLCRSSEDIVRLLDLAEFEVCVGKASAHAVSVSRDDLRRYAHVRTMCDQRTRVQLTRLHQIQQHRDRVRAHKGHGNSCRTET